MKTEKDLYDTLTERWFESEKAIFERYSKLAENNKKIHEKPLQGLFDLDETQRALWETTNLLDQLFIESIKEKSFLFQGVMTLLMSWHENHDQPAMLAASNSFIEKDLASIIKSNRAEDMISKVIDDLRQLILADSLTNKKNS